MRDAQWLNLTRATGTDNMRFYILRILYLFTNQIKEVPPCSISRDAVAAEVDSTLASGGQSDNITAKPNGPSAQYWRGFFYA